MIADQTPACAGRPLSMFFPEGKKAQRRATEDLAKADCAVCPMREACLELAMKVERGQSRHGIYGGLTGLERAKLARARRRAEEKAKALTDER